MGDALNSFLQLLKTLFPFFQIGQSDTALIATLFIGVIIIYFAYNIVRFWIKYSRVKNELDWTINQVSSVQHNELAENYESLFNKLKRNKKFGHFWQEFDETIIKTKDESDNFKIYNTVDAHQFFNFSSLVKTTIDIRYYNAIPGILTGLGLLGTFLGITFGLSGIAHIQGATTQELKNGIFGLLSGAQLAFSTSVWGIFLSLLFNTLDKNLIGKLGDKTRELQSQIDSLFTKTGAEAILVDTLHQSKAQTEELKKFNNDLVFRIGDALDEAVAKNFTPVFQELIGAVEELREVKQESATEAISRLAEEFKSAMTAGANQQISQMSSTLQETAELLNDANKKTARDQEVMKEMLDTHLSSFKDSIDSIMRDLAQNQQANNHEMQQSMEKILNRIDSSLENTDKHFESLMNETQQNVNENLSNVRNMFEHLSTDFAEKIEGLTTRYDKERDSLERILDKVDAQIHNFNDSVKNMDGVSTKIKEIVPRIERTSNNLASAVSRFSEAQEGMLDTLVEIQQKYQTINTENEELLEQMRTALENTRDHWSAYESRFENLRGDLNGVFGELQQGLSAYQSQTKNGLVENLQQFDSIMSDAIGRLSGGVDQIRDVLEEIEIHSNGAN